MSHKQLRESLDTIIDMIGSSVQLDAKVIHQSIRLVGDDCDPYIGGSIEIYEIRTTVGKSEWAARGIEPDEFIALFRFQEAYQFQKKRDFVANYVLFRCSEPQHYLMTLEWIHNLIHATDRVDEWYDWERVKSVNEFLSFMN